MPQTFRATTCLTLLCSLAACSGSGSTSPGSTSTPVLTSIALAAPAAAIAAGATVQLTATPLDQNGGAFSATVNWSSSNLAVATVNSSTGLVSGVSAGLAVITASSGSATNSVTVVVGTAGANPANATVQATTTLAFVPAVVTIAAGGTVQFAFAGTGHTVQFSTSGSPANIGLTSNAAVARTFPTAGTFAYICTIHAGMSGSVVVH